MNDDGDRSMGGESIAFQRSLPAKRVGAGAVIRNSSDEVLVVKPVYKAGWELPGGAVENGESPRSACEREIVEELQLHVEIGQMLCVDYNSSTADYLESLMFCSTSARSTMRPCRRFVWIRESCPNFDGCRWTTPS